MHTIVYKIVTGRHIKNWPHERTVTDIHTSLQGTSAIQSTGGPHSGPPQLRKMVG